MFFFHKGILRNPPGNVTKVNAFDREYWIFKEMKTWKRARETCRNHGGSLAIIPNNRTDPESLKEFVTRPSAAGAPIMKPVWLGLFRTFCVQKGNLQNNIRARYVCVCACVCVCVCVVYFLLLCLE